MQTRRTEGNRRTRRRSWEESSERRRVQTHLLGAELEARSHDVRGLTAAQRRVRELLLAELALYRQAGVFPRNPDFDTPMPYFIDAAGTRCAMAHLMEIGGASDLVQEIAANRNNAFVAELAEDARVLAWLSAVGISPAEAARIQPSYCPSPPNACVCGPRGAALVVRGTLGREALKVDAVAGTGEGPCANVKVGDELQLVTYLTQSATSVTATAEVFAQADGGSSCVVRPVHMLTADGPSCHNGLAPTRLPADLSPEETLAALGAADCEGHLGAKDEAWAAAPANACGDESSAGPFGCGAAGAGIDPSGFTTAAALAAILAYRTARALARRVALRDQGGAHVLRGSDPSIRR